jgi:hypothetical protein
MTDHQRGCEGRTYTCTCGYDAALEARAEAAEAQVARLREHLEVALETIALEGICDAECFACQKARQALEEQANG